MKKLTYQQLQTTIVDLVRVGVSGNAAGVRQLANRVMRATPTGSAGSDQFRSKLAEAMVSSPGTPGFRSVSSPQTADADDLIRWTHPSDSDLPQLALSDPSELQVKRLTDQWVLRDLLTDAGLTPAHTVLLKGPPGVGKTLLAHHIAARLRLPLASINLAEVISSLLGGTGKNLRNAMLAALNSPSVLLMDEFDAVAKRRDDSSDIGELKRIVNVMLLELDHWPEDRLLIAATNHPHLVDQAVERRFEMVIPLDYPSARVRETQLRVLLTGVDMSDWVVPLLADCTVGWSQADIERSVRVARREAVLTGSPVDRALLVGTIQESDSYTDRDGAIARLKETWELSNRAIARIFGVSHPTVANALRRVKERSSHG